MSLLEAYEQEINPDVEEGLRYSLVFTPYHEAGITPDHLRIHDAEHRATAEQLFADAESLIGSAYLNSGYLRYIGHHRLFVSILHTQETPPAVDHIALVGRPRATGFSGRQRREADVIDMFRLHAADGSTEILAGMHTAIYNGQSEVVCERDWRPFVQAISERLPGHESMHGKIQHISDMIHKETQRAEQMWVQPSEH